MASQGFASISGTCLCAAAWKTRCGRCGAKTADVRADVRHVANHAVHRRFHAAVGQIVRDGVEAVLVALVENQLRRLERTNLTAELGADRAARTGDEHAFALDEPTTVLGVQRHLAAREQILNRQGTDLLDAHLAVDELRQARQRRDRHLEVFEQAHEAANGRRRGARDGHEGFAGTASPR